MINPNSFPISVGLNLYNSNGQLSTVAPFTIGPKAQQHMYVNQFIGNEQVGHVEIISASEMITNSMVYEGITGGGTFLTMYGLQALPFTPNTFSNSYNRFLGIENILRLNNLTDQDVIFSVNVTSVFAQAPGALQSFSIPARTSGDLNLNDVGLFGTADNTYGSVSVNTANQNSLQAYVLRRHSSSNGVPDFAAPVLSQ